jgi:transposase
MDFRKKVMDIKARHTLSVRATAERFGLSTRTVQNWLIRLEPKPCGPQNGKTRKLDLAKLEAYYQENNGAYQAEAAEHFGVGRATIWRGLQDLAWTHQKNVGARQGKYTKTR